MRSAPPLAAFALVLCALLAPPARAEGIFSVSGVKVDVTADSPPHAREAGFAQAEGIAFSKLVKRLTLPEELAAKGAPPLVGSALDAVVASVEIEQERPVGSHYMAQLKVSFDPARVRTALQGQGLRVIEARTAPVLVIPEAPAAPALADAWRAAWAGGGYGDELTPLAIAPGALAGPPNWAQAAPWAAQAGAARALYANLSLAGGTAVADLVEVSASGTQRSLAAVTAPVTPGAEPAALQALAEAANAAIQDEWKHGLAAGGGQRARLVASAVYANQAEWRRLQQGLEGAAKTVVSGVSIDAVSKSAALVSFSYVGGRAQLAAELLRNGVALQDSPQGEILKLAPGGA